MLQVQVHIKLPKPKSGIRYSSSFLDTIADRWLKGEPIPKRIKVTMIEWRSGRGPWRSEDDTRRMNRVRGDFQAIAQAGFKFTGAEV